MGMSFRKSAQGVLFSVIPFFAYTPSGLRLRPVSAATGFIINGKRLWLRNKQINVLSGLSGNLCLGQKLNAILQICEASNYYFPGTNQPFLKAQAALNPFRCLRSVKA